MKHYEYIPAYKVADVMCDICGKSCTSASAYGVSDANYATLHANWGYSSKKDLQEHECHMCEQCYDQVAQFIKSIATSSGIRSATATSKMLGTGDICGVEVTIPLNRA